MPDLKMLNSTKYLYKLTFIKCSYVRLSPAVRHRCLLCVKTLFAPLYRRYAVLAQVGVGSREVMIAEPSAPVG